MAYIDPRTDAELAYEVTGPGQVVTRTPAQIAAYRAQQGGANGGAGSLGTMAEWMSSMGGGANPYQPGTMSTSNRFETGLSDAETRLRNLLDNPDSINQSAAYKFRVGQGQEALQRSMGAKGMLNSGNRLMELTKYGQDMGSQEYDAQAGRLGNLLGNYSQSWIGDKNANTNAFTSQSNAWNTAEGNKDRRDVGMAGVWADVNRGGTPAGGSPISRTSSQMTWQNPSAFQGSWNPETDPAIQRMRQSSIDAYNY